MDERTPHPDPAPRPANPMAWPAPADGADPMAAHSSAPDAAQQLPGAMTQAPAPVTAPSLPTAATEWPASVAAPSAPAPTVATPGVAPATAWPASVTAPGTAAPATPSVPAAPGHAPAPTMPGVQLPPAAPGTPWSANGATPPPMSFEPAEPPRRSRGPLWLAIAALALVAVGVGAFFVLRSGSESGDAIVDGTELATERPSDADGSGGGYSFAAATSAASEAQSIRLDMTMNAAGYDADVVATIDRASRRFAMTMSGDFGTDEFGSFGLEMPESIEWIMDADTGTTYMSGAMFGMGADTEWVSFTLDPAMTGGDDLDSYIDEMFANPLDATLLFGQFDPIEVGLEELNGETVMHYRIAMDVETLLAEEPDTLTGYGDVDLSLLDEIVYDVWVSEDDQLRRIAMDADVFGEQVSMVMDVEVNSESVSIELPDPSNVTDMDDLFGGAFSYEN